MKEWFVKMQEKDGRENGPILWQKVEELAKKLGKTDLMATEGWFHRWKKKRENICFTKLHGLVRAMNS